VAKKKSTPGELLVCSLPRAHQRYDIEERYEAGMVLVGSEVKSMRARRADLDGAYASLSKDGQLWLHKMHVAPYEQAGAFGHEPKRARKLLLKKTELKRIHGRLTAKGYTLVPLRVYFRDGWAKVELGLGKGKKTIDRREDLKRKADLREARAAMGKRR
jgi:SsrA-binding protein